MFQHKYNKLGALGGGGLGAVLTGAALTGSLNPVFCLISVAQSLTMHDWRLFHSPGGF